MSDILSQDQIDALLNAQGFDGSGSGVDPDDPAAAYPELLKTFDLFCNQAGTVISTVLNRKVSFQTEICEEGSVDTIREKMPSVLLALKIPVASAVDGVFYLLIQKTDVAILSDLMMMGDGTAEYSEDYKDAIGEMFNQVMGAYVTALSGEWGNAVATGSIEVSEFDLDHPPFSIDTCDAIMISRTIENIEGSSFLIILVPRKLSGRISKIARPITSSTSASMTEDVGLNMAELDDLSKVSGFTETTETEFKPVSALSSTSQQGIEMLLDIDLDVSIELGKSMLSIKRILELAPGSIVELDRMAGEPVDLLVNNKVVAKGEVVVIDESFGIRIVSLVSPEERIRSLR